MNKRITSLLILLHFMSICSYAQDPPTITIHVEEAGTLSNLISGYQGDRITNLKLSGYLNGDDFYCLRWNSMLGAKYIKYLDLSEVNIVEGGRAYYNSSTSSPYNYHYTSTNEITSYLFYQFTKAESIILPKSANSGVGDRAFCQCSELLSIDIPNGSTSIGRKAFYTCDKLSKITIPNSVSYIWPEAFIGCSEIKEIHCENPNPPRFSSSVFSLSATRNALLYVPMGSYNAYASADGWKEFRNIVEMTTTSNESIQQKKYKVSSSNGSIVIESIEQISASIYNINGQLMKLISVSGNEQVSVSTGVYIVKINNESTKVLVK